MAQEARPKAPRPVLYQLGRLGERFVPGDPPLDLGLRPRPLILGRKEDALGVDVGRVFVDDPWMSVRHARIGDGGRPSTRAGAVSQRLFIEDLGSKSGVVVNGVPSPKAPLLHGDIVETGHTFWVYVEERCAEPVLTSAVECGAFVTWHPRLGAQLTAVHAAVQPATALLQHVLVCGPDGSGKGFLGRTLHQVSGRTGRFLHLDCAEKRPRKLAVELFGKDGTGGRLHEAAGGTLLLEHIEAMPPDLQLRVAEALRPRTRTGNGRSVAVDARVIATCRVVEPHAAETKLEPRLLEALAARVDLPPLEDRLCDLGLLLDDFLSRAKGETRISRDACRVLFRHRFGQHIRGFARVVEAASSLAVDDGDSGVVSVEHLPFCVAGADAMKGLLQRAQDLVGAPSGQSHRAGLMLSATADGEAVAPDDSHAAVHGFSSVIETQVEDSSSPPVPSRRGRGTFSDIGPRVTPATDEVDADAVAAALRAARGNVTAAARLLGRPRAVVLRWCRDLGLDPLSFRAGPP